MLFCHIDSELSKHPKLRDEKGLVGLPSMAFLDAHGAVLVTVPFDQRTIDGLHASGRRALRYVTLRKNAAAGDAAAAADFLLMQLEERQLSLAQAKERRAALVHIEDAGLAATLDARLVDLEVDAALRAQMSAKQPRADLGPRFLRMHRDGPHPSPYVSRGFWFAILEWAEAERKVDEFREGLDGMRKALAITDPHATWVPSLLADQEAKLRRLRAR